MSTDSLFASGFFSSLSHELRSPIASIVSLSELLVSDHSIDCQQKQQFVNDINYLALEALEFIGDLLDICQTEGKLSNICELKKENIKKLIASSVRIVKGIALKHNITIFNNIDDNLNNFQCDAKKIKQILVNLLVNSIKYSPDESSVFVNAKLNSNNQLVISIKDQGIGMTKDEIANIFNIHKVRKENNTYMQLNKKINSHGIGLPLVKEMVDLHNGNIEFVSEGRNKGLEVILTF